jgi:hypothetical protein
VLHECALCPEIFAIVNRRLPRNACFTACIRTLNPENRYANVFASLVAGDLEQLPESTAATSSLAMKVSLRRLVIGRHFLLPNVQPVNFLIP